ncbi:MAG: Imm1 family immunity protein [Pseudomonadota bacterium]|nr:Imm1 family immunity protein [Pseudomonadota bacterium]
MRAYTTDTDAVDLVSPDHLLAVANSAVAARGPVMLYLELEGGTVMAAGLGSPETVLTFWLSDGSGSYHSLGNVERKDYLVFRSRYESGTFVGEMALPAEAAMVALREFLATGERPACVTWEADR